MLNIPVALFTKYSILLNKKQVPISVHNNYKKWLRYYLDFCHKYCHQYADKESLKHFMIKLHEKHQSPAMQEEAAKAVSLYYEMLQPTFPKDIKSVFCMGEEISDFYKKQKTCRIESIRREGVHTVPGDRKARISFFTEPGI